jgi:acyl carrier protein
VERPDLPADFLAPEGPIEQRIAVVYQQLFGLDQVGATDSFFDLGGDSLLGLQLITQLNREFDALLDVRELFEHPTVAQLAAWIEKGGTPAHAAPERAGTDPEIQELLAALDRLPGGVAADLVQQAIEPDGQEAR